MAIRHFRLKMQKETFISITDRQYHNSVGIHFPKEVIEIIGKENIVVELVEGYLSFRQATIIDTKILLINANNMVSWTSLKSKDFVGKYDYEIEGSIVWLGQKVAENEPVKPGIVSGRFKINKSR
jgi:hypothetical protein